MVAKYVVAGVIFLSATHLSADPVELSSAFRVTGFTDLPTNGDVNKSPLYTGRLDAYFTMNNIWDGGLLNLQLEYVDGDDFIGLGSAGVIWPTNVYSALPRITGPGNANVSLFLSHQFNENASLSFGKFNAIEMADQLPISGGKGKGGFLYTGIAAPASFVLPPYVLGGIASIATPKVNYSLFIYDPNNAQGSEFLDELFSDGVVFNTSSTYKALFSDKPGFYGLNIIYSTQDGINFSNSSPGPLVDVFFRKTKGVGFAALNFQQYLSYSTDRPNEGWGIFGQVGVGSSGNQLDNNYIFGIAGASPIRGREADRIGLAWSLYDWSDGLVQQFSRTGGGLQDEWAVEAFYESEITEIFRLGANVMMVRPGLSNYTDYFQVGLRVKAAF